MTTTTYGRPRTSAVKRMRVLDPLDRETAHPAPATAASTAATMTVMTASTLVAVEAEPIPSSSTSSSSTSSPSKVRRVSRMNSKSSAPNQKNTDSDSSVATIPLLRRLVSADSSSNISVRKQPSPPKTKELTPDMLTHSSTSTSTSITTNTSLKSTYFGRTRSFLATAPSLDDEYGVAADLTVDKIDEGLSSDDEDDRKKEVRSLHELRAQGESTRFSDKLQYIFSGLGPSEPVNVRRTSFLDLVVTMTTDAAFNNRARVFGFNSRLFSAAFSTENDDICLAIATFAVLAWISQDPKTVGSAISFVYNGNGSTTIHSRQSQKHQKPDKQRQQTLWSWVSNAAVKDSDALVERRKSKYERELMNDVKRVITDAAQTMSIKPPTPLSTHTIAITVLTLLLNHPHYNHPDPATTPPLQPPAKVLARITGHLLCRWRKAQSKSATAVYTNFFDALRTHRTAHCGSMCIADVVHVLAADNLEPVQQYGDYDKDDVEGSIGSGRLLTLLKSLVDLTAASETATLSLTTGGAELLNKVVSLLARIWAILAPYNNDGNKYIDAVVLLLASFSNIARRGGVHRAAFFLIMTMKADAEAKNSVNDAVGCIALVADIFRVAQERVMQEKKNYTATAKATPYSAVSLHAALFLGFLVEGGDSEWDAVIAAVDRSTEAVKKKKNMGAETETTETTPGEGHVDIMDGVRTVLESFAGCLPEEMGKEGEVADSGGNMRQRVFAISQRFTKRSSI